MARFSQATRNEIIAVARRSNIDPAALLAIAEVESGGRAFAMIDGRAEPLIRFEGHYFDRLLSPQKRTLARKRRLSSPRAGAVKNPRSQRDRWRLIGEAASIDRAAAYQSVSWGIGQVMGSHWKSLGYESIDALVAEARSGVAGQVELMVRFMRTNGLMPYVRDRAWAGFARRYNGPAYKKNRYDERLAKAFESHRAQLRAKPEPVSRKPATSRGEVSLQSGAKGLAVRELQRMLTAAGYVVRDDGVFGPQTRAAVVRFQRRAGLKHDGVVGPRTRSALKSAVPRWGDGWMTKLKLPAPLRWLVAWLAR